MPAAERRLSPERRSRILDAARRVMLMSGLRGSTMEAIAREAGVAKPTLYGYFPDKETVFVAILEEAVRDMIAAFDAALSSDDDPVAAIGAAVAAKHRVVTRALAGSPHAAEFYSEHDRSGAQAARLVDGHVEAAIVARLRAAGASDAEWLTRILMDSALGIGMRMTAEAELDAALRLLAERLLRPAFAEAHTGSDGA